MTTDIDAVIRGLQILAKYDDTGGDVSPTYNKEIYAGPDEHEVPQEDALLLEHLGWEFDEDINRWCWRP